MVSVKEYYKQLGQTIFISVVFTPPPPPQVSVFPHGTTGEGHTHVRVRWGGPNSDDWRKSLALCLLCTYKDIQLYRRSAAVFFLYRI